MGRTRETSGAKIGPLEWLCRILQLLDNWLTNNASLIKVAQCRKIDAFLIMWYLSQLIG